MCYSQLYNEEVHDLLSSDQTKLQIHESKESGIYVAGLREDIVTSAEHVLELLYSGEKLRHFGETKMNKTSSRSHTIFRMVSNTIDAIHDTANNSAQCICDVVCLCEALPRSAAVHILRWAATSCVTHMPLLLT